MESIMKLSKNHKKFADEFIKDQNGTRAYLSAYPGANKNSARTAANRLLQNVNIERYINSVLDIINKNVTSEVIKNQTDKELKKALEFEEKREILAKIARGEVETTIKKPVWDRDQKKYVLVSITLFPTAKDIINAIAEDNSMTGESNKNTTNVNINTMVQALIAEGKLTLDSIELPGQAKKMLPIE